MKFNNRSANQLKLAGLSSSEKEIIDLIKAWAAISFAFAVTLSADFSSIYSKFIVASLTVGIGFLFHEMGHKIVAQKYGCFAEFRSSDQMLLLAVLMSFGGFVVAAPGAVIISGRMDKTKTGKIAAAGPIVNLLLASLFFLLLLSGEFKQMALYGLTINSYLALFNMIPFWIFDGSKIFKWDKRAYFGILAVSILFFMNARSLGG